jgi:hypothetical protein
MVRVAGTLRKGAKDGAPGMVGLDWGEQATARAKTEADPYGMTNKRTDDDKEKDRQRQTEGQTRDRQKWTKDG